MHTFRGRLLIALAACAALLTQAFASARRAIGDEALERAIETRIAGGLAAPFDRDPLDREPLDAGAPEPVAHDGDHPTERIVADVRDGIVTLHGSTRSLPLKERAELVAERTRGVRAVVNRLRVEPTVDRTAAELRRALHDALRSTPASGGRAVRTVVDAGHVTLSGTVASWDAKRSLGRLAKGVAGVKAVDNRIEVQYPPRRPRVG